jgi:hypothetical protein
MERTVRLLLCALLVCLVPSLALPASGDPSPEQVKRAQAYFQAGRAFYRAAQYEEAIRQFETGYAIVPKAEFLLNIGQAERRLYRPEKARAALLRYLAEAAPNAPNRADAKELLDEVEHALAIAAQPSPTPAPQIAAEPSPAPVVAVVAPPPPTAKKTTRSGIRRYWWLIPVTLVVAGGVSVGLYFGLRPSDPCAGVAACIKGN